MRRYTKPPLESAKPGDELARKIGRAFPEPSNDVLGKPNVRPYYCEQCDRSFLCQSSVDKHLWYHLRREVGIWEEPTPPGESYQCAECAAQFRILDTYVQHMGSHLAYPCNCRLWYPNKLALERHALKSHSRRNLHNFLRSEREARFWQ
ncbi:hypothetical protein FOCC_FOCC004074 [Frankliniella occidentalis]|uniref:Zinc finger protein 560-like n=1 Tax=Frankliniella occidentalis TaxID=133901 RepID=A0A6J1SY68_FRAOC|nr:zinc finger protein 560-like [Frankliniella occidentalis]KAE8749167.1 hypothetical protein FOCC_FOCC004074 [Frankliniella occidentalis]